MTTGAQLESFALECENPRSGDDLLELFGMTGLTVDEAYARANPGEDFDHARVDSFRVTMRLLREQGKIKDSGAKRVGASSGRKQTVWILGDDREIVEQHRRAKLRKFPTDWLVDEIARRTQ